MINVELFFSNSDKAIKRHEKYIKNKHHFKIWALNLSEVTKT
jgi:hypothetical protein